MNIDELIKECKKEREQDIRSAISKISGDIDRIIAEMEKIKNGDFPEDTDVLQKLIDAQDREVIFYAARHIDSGEKAKFQCFSGLSIEINYSNPEHYPIVCSLIGEAVISKIVDANTGEILFENPYWGKGYSYQEQEAMIFGKKEAIKHMQAQLEAKKSELSAWQQDLEMTQDVLTKIPSWIERGEKLTYRQLKTKWAERVVKKAFDLYNGSDIEDALRIMEALDNGTSIEEANQPLVGTSVYSAASVNDMVLHFSKRGVEFFKACDETYKRCVEQDEKEDLKSWQDYFDKIEERNKSFTKEDRTLA